jgi:flagellar export protein FliJ
MPSSFTFRLERVLALRRTHRDVAELALKQIAAVIVRHKARIAQLRTELTAVQMQVATAHSLSGLELNAMSGYRRHLEAAMQRIEAQLKEQQLLFEKQRARCTEAQRNYKLVEKLKERKQAEFVLEQNREMENFAGEMYLARWPAKQKASGRAQP